ncbi:16S rRNA (guanine(966)-N(2))-methyltransferase RsmD [Jiangella sp. DSM 45060]|uniref:16S rRNA (guanine(966)-N(2))-methyltransferase RsmD n=1 Tax=Jiangella sp. DSM 45060 TaxID=1798224 RepID=UPI00087D1A1B|nr:16S rRNA (guanine(966)-N(2))-methyltransferase RsmD [Jiangella sp. DSM 45060]SDS63729.1 16S rRNA (guanine966-N2)-methyltransferase [Jiangella sp. DSM 45060]
MTRIVAGAAGGRRLSVPPGNRTRPTSDRVREALFSSLAATFGGGLGGLRVLDLYAGSGALGLEALSRGAEHCLLVESDARAAAVIRANVKAVGLPGAVVVAATAERTLATPPDAPYDIVLADPPYAMVDAELSGVLVSLTAGWLSPDAVVVVERDRRSAPLTWPDDIEPGRERRYGETVLWYGRAR